MSDTPRAEAAGALFAIAAYGAWGVVPLFWRELDGVDPVEILAHRVVWSLVFVAALLMVKGRMQAVMTALRDRALRRTLLVTSVLIAINWGLFIWAVTARRLVDASLGYFINPLVSVALGIVVLGERLRRIQLIAVVLGALGLIGMIVSARALPYVALLLASTFATYGLFRKTAKVDSLVGLFIETLVVAPVALGFLVYRGSNGLGVFASGSSKLIVLATISGPITALPLAAFAAAARRLPLSRLGFFQYLAPSLQFGIAVLVFGEPLGGGRLASFAVIWAALVLSSVDLFFSTRRRER